MSSYTSLAVFHNEPDTQPYLEKTAIGEVAANQVLVKASFASVNPIDIKLQSWKTDSTPAYTLRDFAGIVEAAGSDVSGKYPVGDKVYGSVRTSSDKNFVGSYTLVEVNDSNVIEPLPQGLDLKQGAAIGIVFSTAHEMLQRAAIRKPLNEQSRLLVLGGATSVGAYVIQLAKKHFHVGTVVTTTSLSSAEYATGFGADHVLDYKDPNFSSNLVQYAKREGKFDAILDTAGFYSDITVFPEILIPLNEGNVYVSIAGEPSPANLDPKLVDYQRMRVTKREFIHTAATFFQIPGVQIPIDSVLPINKIVTAWDKVKFSKAHGKVVLQF